MDRDVSRPYIDTARTDQETHSNRAEDESDIEGYDEAQRAEIAEFEGGGDSDGTIITDMAPDLGGDLDDEEVEDLEDSLPEERDERGY